MKKFTTLQLVFIFTPFVFSFAFGLDIYIPIVPQMTGIFNTSAARVQLTLSLYLFLAGTGQLLLGPLADRFGRKPLFYISSLSFALGSLLCAISPTIVLLIVARLVSAMGACGMMVTAFATVRDLFHDDESAKMFSFLNGAIGISPTFAPILGGYLAFNFGWQSVFIFLTLLGFVAFFIAYRFIEESCDKSQRIAIDKTIMARYWQILTTREFIINATLAGFAEGIFFGFFSTSPFILIEEIGIPSEQFGFYFAFFGCSIAFGGLLSGRLITKERLNTLLASAIGMIFLGGTSMLACAFLSSLTITGYLLPMIIACSGSMFLLGAAASAALAPFAQMAGTASALFGAVQFAISALIGTVVMLFPTSSTVPYGISIVVIACLSALLFLMQPRRIVAASDGLSTIPRITRMLD